MDDNPRLAALQVMKVFFERSTGCLEEEDAGFAPVPGMFSTAEQIAHVAQSIEWFLDGAFRDEGFDLDFPGLETKVREVKTLAEARAWWDRAVDRAMRLARDETDESWNEPIAQGPIMGGAPRHTILEGLADHTAHHRGALTVHARLCGRTPQMPYG